MPNRYQAGISVGAGPWTGPGCRPVRLDGVTSVFDWLDTRADERRSAGLTRQPRPRRTDADHLDLAGNDYLRLSRDKRVSGSAAAALLPRRARPTRYRL